MNYSDIQWQRPQASRFSEVNGQEFYDPGGPGSYYDAANKRQYMQLPEGNNGGYWAVDGWEPGMTAKDMTGKRYTSYNNDGSVMKQGSVDWTGNNPYKDFALATGALLTAGFGGAALAGAGGAGAGAGAAAAAPWEAGFVGSEALGGAAAAGGAGAGAGAAAGAGAGAGAGAASSFLPSTAGGWGSLIGPGIAGASALYGASAAKDAAGIQAQSATEANALQREMFNKQTELQEPFRQGGLTGMNRLLDLYGLSKNTSAEGYGSAMRDFSMADYRADPGYQFRQEQGEKALTRAGAASGLLGSGKYLKDAMKFNSGLASQEYGQAFDRFQVNRANKIAPLQSLMGSGQTSANTLGQAAGNYATNVGNNILGAGNAQAAGTMGAANALAGGVNSGWNMYQNQQYINKLPTYGAR